MLAQLARAELMGLKIVETRVRRGERDLSKKQLKQNPTYPFFLPSSHSVCRDSVSLPPSSFMLQHVTRGEGQVKGTRTCCRVVGTCSTHQHAWVGTGPRDCLLFGKGG